MNDKPKEKVYAERFDASKKEREELSKKAIDQHEKNKPQKKRVESLNLPKKTIYYKIEKKERTGDFLSVLFLIQYSALRLKNNHLELAVAEEKASSMQRSIH